MRYIRPSKYSVILLKILWSGKGRGENTHFRFLSYKEVFIRWVIVCPSGGARFKTMVLELLNITSGIILFCFMRESIHG